MSVDEWKPNRVCLHNETKIRKSRPAPANRAPSASKRRCSRFTNTKAEPIIFIRGYRRWSIMQSLSSSRDSMCPRVNYETSIEKMCTTIRNASSLSHLSVSYLVFSTFWEHDLDVKTHQFLFFMFPISPIIAVVWWVLLDCMMMSIITNELSYIQTW